MSGFEPLNLEWSGRTVTIRPNRMMGAMQVYERHISPQDFLLIARGGIGAAPAVCCAAYGALLRYAGERVIDDDIYVACRDEGWAGDQSLAITDKLLELQLLRLPPAQREEIMAAGERQAEEGGPEPEKEPEPENPTPAAPASSSKPTRRRSATNG
jgi:hypothetical protein